VEGRKQTSSLNKTLSPSQSESESENVRCSEGRNDVFREKVNERTWLDKITIDEIN